MERKREGWKEERREKRELNEKHALLYMKEVEGEELHALFPQHFMLTLQLIHLHMAPLEVIGGSSRK